MNHICSEGAKYKLNKSENVYTLIFTDLIVEKQFISDNICYEKFLIFYLFMSVFLK